MDPDIKKASVAVIDEAGKVESIFLSKICNKAGRSARDSMVIQMRQIIAYSAYLPCYCGEEYTAVMEGQRYLGGKSTANPQDLIHLGQMGAFLLGVVSGDRSGVWDPPSEIKIPYPQEWKGSLAKRIHHTQICSSLGLSYTVRKNPGKDIVPDLNPTTEMNVVGMQSTAKPQKLNPGDWTDIMDSIGLANWARIDYLKTGLKNKYLAMARGES